MDLYRKIFVLCFCAIVIAAALSSYWSAAFHLDRMNVLLILAVLLVIVAALFFFSKHWRRPS